MTLFPKTGEIFNPKHELEAKMIKKEVHLESTHFVLPSHDQIMGIMKQQSLELDTVKLRIARKQLHTLEGEQVIPVQVASVI